MKLYNADCLSILPSLADDSVDLILTDPPYGTTPCKWDSIISLDKMWVQLKRIIKKDGAILLFGIEPFSSVLRSSNFNWFKYDWIWEKQIAANFLQAKYAPMKVHEIVSVFSNAAVAYSNGNTSIKYNPQMTVGKPYKHNGSDKIHITGPTVRTPVKVIKTKNNGFRYPRSIIKFDKDNFKRIHPTQKPVALLEYLIKTYSNKNDTVLDFTMGSGSTGVAAKNLNREFIGIELDKQYFEIATNRINENPNSVHATKAPGVYTSRIR